MTSTLARRSRSTTSSASHSSVPSAKNTTALLIFTDSLLKKRTAGRVLPCPAARGPCYSSAGCSAFSSSRRRSTLSSLLMTRLTRLMMALDAPMLPMMLV